MINMAAQVRRELKGQTLAGLINNAGIANHAVLMHQPIEEFKRVMEVNLVGTLAVTQASISALRPPQADLALISTCREPQKVQSCASLISLFNASNGGSTLMHRQQHKTQGVAVSRQGCIVDGVSLELSSYEGLLASPRH